MNDEHRTYGWKSAERNESHDYLVPAVTGMLRASLGAGRARVIDLGCGSGYVTSRIAALGYEVVGLDASEDGILLARDAYAGVRFEVASVYDDDLPRAAGGPADAVVSLEVVEHLFYPRRLFTQARQLLRPGGRLFVSTPYHGYLKNLAISLLNGWDRHFGVDCDGGHIKFFSPRTLRQLAEDEGFRELRFSGVGRAPLLWKSMILSARGAGQ
jgi:2-polyprenyl-3-methyl-5-hydroxy-6-metoxy-1,4-benzoquinol methylase